MSKKVATPFSFSCEHLGETDVEADTGLIIAAL